MRAACGKTARAVRKGGRRQRPTAATSPDPTPAKPANKVERSTAELVEGYDGTKRNAELQSTVRTQSREAVTQAQARIRGAVTRNEKEKLTALLHHVQHRRPAVGLL